MSKKQFVLDQAKAYGVSQVEPPPVKAKVVDEVDRLLAEATRMLVKGDPVVFQQVIRAINNAQRAMRRLRRMG